MVGQACHLHWFYKNGECAPVYWRNFSCFKLSSESFVIKTLKIVCCHGFFNKFMEKSLRKQQIKCSNDFYLIDKTHVWRSHFLFSPQEFILNIFNQFLLLLAYLFNFIFLFVLVVIMKHQSTNPLCTCSDKSFMLT